MAMPSAAPVRPIVSRLAAVQRGRQKSARRILIHGAGGLGKTTLAASAPAPIFLDCNQGSSGFDVARYTFDDNGRTKPESFEELLAALRDIAKTGYSSGFRTVVVDVLSDVEPLIWAEVIRKDGKARSIEEVGGGYGKGVKAAIDEWRRMVAVLEECWRSGLHVVLLDHSSVQKEKNATGADYGSFLPKIDPGASRFLHTWSDLTLFLQVDTVLVPDDANDRKAKKLFAESSGKRLLHARPAAEWLAKSRPELPDPIEMPSAGGWDFLETLVLKARIEEFAKTLPEERRDRALDALNKAGDDLAALTKLDDHCAAEAAKKGA